MKIEDRTLGDVAAELEGLEGLVTMVSMLVQPTEESIHGNVPTQETIEQAFFSIRETIRHIKNEVNEFDDAIITLMIEHSLLS